MRYQEFTPHPLLAGYVQVIWILESENKLDFGPRQRIVPDAIVEAVFHFGEPFVTRFADGSVERQPMSFVVSQTHRHIEIQPTRRSGFIAVRFYPWGGYHFFDVPVKEFADGLIASDLLWGDKARVFEERIALARNDRERVGLVERFLLERFREHHKDDLNPYVRFIWDGRGQIGIKEMARHFGVTERQLERKFNAAVGAPPKHYALIARFLQACRFLRTKPFRSLTEAAHLCGYYDQSHFINDFKDFSGLTPREFLVHPALSFFVLDLNLSDSYNP
jgi:AraC-like DNA-binding protein